MNGALGPSGPATSTTLPPAGLNFQVRPDQSEERGRGTGGQVGSAPAAVSSDGQPSLPRPDLRTTTRRLPETAEPRAFQGTPTQRVSGFCLGLGHRIRSHKGGNR